MNKIEKYLKSQDVDYQLFQHAPAYTAMEIAEAQHVPGDQLIKSVIVKGDEGYVMIVLNATHHLDFDRLEAACGQRNWYLATEEELVELFPEVEAGAEPPFGDLPIYVDTHLESSDRIYFNAGNHTETVCMKYEDWKRLTSAKVLPLGVHV